MEKKRRETSRDNQPLSKSRCWIQLRCVSLKFCTFFCLKKGPLECGKKNIVINAPPNCCGFSDAAASNGVEGVQVATQGDKEFRKENSDFRFSALALVTSFLKVVSHSAYVKRHHHEAQGRHDVTNVLCSNFFITVFM